MTIPTVTQLNDAAALANRLLAAINTALQEIGASPPPPPPPPPPPSGTASPAGTTITRGVGSITDNRGDVWIISPAGGPAPPGGVCVNGTFKGFYCTSGTWDGAHINWVAQP